MALTIRKKKGKFTSSRKQLIIIVVWGILFLHLGRPTITSSSAVPSNKEIVLLIHYHKTGNFFVGDLLRNLHETSKYHGLRVVDYEYTIPQKQLALLKNNNNNNNNDDSSKNNNNKLRRKSSPQQEDTASILMGQPKRKHNQTTGCPIWNLARMEPGTVHMVTAPDIFCPLQQQQTLPPATRIIHFVRDPIDMALSNYLYHKQDPTPEPWVKSTLLNPCQYDTSRLEYLLEELKVVNMMDIEKVQHMCQSYRPPPPTTTTSRGTLSFHDLLRELPNYEGLRLATAQFLIANNSESGGDLLRMPNNIQRLQAWQEESESSMMLRTVSMDQLIGDMKSTTRNVVNFILHSNDDDTNNSNKNHVAEKIANQMTQTYKGKKDDSTRGNSLQSIRSSTTTTTNKKQGVSHVSQGVLNKSERQLLKETLQADEVLGSILLKMRTIVDRALVVV